jgi:squalene-hopene/tetraprenyl-beta-curcumene cyclase
MDGAFSPIANIRDTQTEALAQALRTSIGWLLREQTLEGFWVGMAEINPPGGWAFERANILYPDVDDTALALLVWSQVRRNCGLLREQIGRAVERGAA